MVATHSEIKKPSFWLLHLIGWLAYVFIFSTDNILFSGGHQEHGIDIVVPLLISAAIAALLTLPLRYLFAYCWGLDAKSLVLVIIVASIVVAAIWTPIKNAVVWHHVNGFDVVAALTGKGEEDFVPRMLFMTLSYSFFMVLVWCCLYFGINYHFRLLETKQQHLQAVRLSHIAQIKMLRYQLNPHFLFNTLNAISTLVIKGNADNANSMLARLSNFLRFSLDNDPEKKVELLEELNALLLYLDIERMRFEERLEISIEIEPDTEQLLVPSLLLQPLVENSIKYAVSQMSAGGWIKIQAHRDDKFLQLLVIDNGPGAASKRQLKTKPRRGVGLQNVESRLQVLYPDSYQFAAGPQAKGGFQVAIRIPAE